MIAMPVIRCRIDLPERTCNYTWLHLVMLRRLWLGKTTHYPPFWLGGLASIN